MDSAIKEEKRYVGVKEIIAYGAASGGQILGYNTIRSQMTFYLVTVFGVPSSAVATMITIMGFWDAINDPIMGVIVDKTRTRYGKLRPFLLFIPFPLGLATIMYFGGARFLSGVDSSVVKIVYMCVTYFIWEFLYTIADIPFGGLSASISPSPLDRSNAITSARLFSGTMAGPISPILLFLIDLSNKGKISLDLKSLFMCIGIVAGTVGMGLFLNGGIQCRERVVQNSDEPKLIDCFKFMFRNKPLLLIVIANILATVEGITDTFAQYFYMFSLNAASWGTVAGIPGTISGYVMYAIIPSLEKRFSSKKLVRFSYISKFLVSLVVFLGGVKAYRNPAVVVPLMGLYQFTNGIVWCIRNICPSKMLCDSVDYMEWKSGERSEGMAFALNSFGAKLNSSLATALATALIPVIKLVTTEKDGAVTLVENPTVNTRFWLWALMTIIPPTVSLLTLIPYRFYDLEGNKLNTIRKELAERREERSRAATDGEVMAEV